MLAANDCRVVLTFLQRSPSFSLASASRVQHNNESWHTRQRAYLTNTSNLNSYDSRTRTTVELVRQSNSCVGWCVHAKKKNVPQRCSSIAFDFFDLSSSNLVQESSVDLWDNLHKVRGLPHNALHFPSYREPTLRRVCWAAVTNCAPVTSLMTQTRFAVGFTRWHSADRKLQVGNRFKPQVDIQFVTDLGLIFENIRPGRGRGPISGG